MTLMFLNLIECIDYKEPTRTFNCGWEGEKKDAIKHADGVAKSRNASSGCWRAIVGCTPK